MFLFPRYSLQVADFLRGPVKKQKFVVDLISRTFEAEFRESGET